MNFKCPCCNYNGAFATARLPFFIFSLLDVSRERQRAKRTYVCPQCDTQIVVSKKAKQLAMAAN